jgi:hypothetical protein
MIELDIGACVCCVCLMSVAMNYADYLGAIYFYDMVINI